MNNNEASGHLKSTLNLTENQINRFLKDDSSYQQTRINLETHSKTMEGTSSTSCDMTTLSYNSLVGSRETTPYMPSHISNLSSSSSAMLVNDNIHATDSEPSFMELTSVVLNNKSADSATCGESEAEQMEIFASLPTTYSQQPYEQVPNNFCRRSSIDILASTSTSAVPQADSCLGFVKYEVPDTDLNFATIKKLSRKQSKAKANGKKSMSQQLIDLTEDGEITENYSISKISKDLHLEYDFMKNAQNNRSYMAPLPKMAQRLMGEANTRIAMGDYQSATNLCMEVIRIAPWAPKPFETLSEICEQRGDLQKAHQYELLAAHLSNTSFDRWIQLAGICENKGETIQAIGCYNRAAKANENDYNCRWRVGVMYQQLGNFRMAMEAFKSVVKVLPDTEIKSCMELARDIAKSCHGHGQTSIAISTLQEAACKHPQAITPEDTNMLCELLLSEKRYIDVLKLLQFRCGISMTFDGEENSTEQTIKSIGDIETDTSVPVDLISKIVAACLRLGKFDVADKPLSAILAMNPSDVGDVQYDIAEIFMDLKRYADAIKVLEILVDSSMYSLAGVWLKKAECHRQMSDYEKAKLSYMQVIDKAPGHTKALLDLSFVLRQLKQFTEALQILKEAENYEIDGVEQVLIYLERFVIYKQWATDKNHDFELNAHAGDAGIILMSVKLKVCFPQAKVSLVQRTARHKFRGEKKLLRWMSDVIGGSDKTLDPASGDADVFSMDEWLKFFEETISLLRVCKRYKDCINLCELMLFSNVFYHRKEIRRMIELKDLEISIESSNFKHAYQVMRQWIVNDIYTPHIWNVFNQVCIRMDDQRHHKFCLRFTVQHSEQPACTFMNGHNSLVCGSYKHSLSEYLKASNFNPLDPLCHLLMGITYIHICTQRFSTQKNFLCAQGIAFLYKYCQYRDLSQEAFYNIGRAMHQLGMVTHALHFYKKALESPPVIIDNAEKDTFDLSMEIAYNLACLYKQSGNDALVQEIIETYCVV